MPHEIEADWDQFHMLPACVEDWIGSDHAARFIREFVDELDLGDLGFLLVSGGTQGRPRYATKLLLRVWLYGYFEKVRSSRQLEKACTERMGFVWLCGGHRPDHNSLWRFWKENRAALKKLFKQSVQVAMQLKMVGFLSQAIDGTKIQSCSGTRSSCDQASLQRQLERLDKSIEELEQALEQTAGGGEADASLPRELRQQSALRERVREALTQVQAGTARHIHPNEPDARRMGVDGRNRFAYNAQAAVDSKEQVIVAAEVTNAPNDKGQLKPMIEQASQTTGQNCAQTLADGGYSSAEQIAQTQAHNVVMPLPSSVENKDERPYHASNFTYESKSDEVICPQGRRIPFQRERLRGGARVRVYRSAQTCKGCPVRTLCTKDRHGRTIDICANHEALQAHRSKMATPESQQAYQLRARIVEPVFGWIKELDGLRRWSYRGLENVTVQWKMLCTAQNLRSIFQKWLQSRSPRPLATS